MWACLLLSVFNLKDQIMNYLVCREIKNATDRLLSHPLCISMSALVACLVAVLYVCHFVASLLLFPCVSLSQSAHLVSSLLYMSSE